MSEQRKVELPPAAVAAAAESDPRRAEWPPGVVLAGDASGEAQAEAAAAGFAAAAGLLVGSIVSGDAARLADRLLAYLDSADREVPWDVVVPGVVLVASWFGWAVLGMLAGWVSDRSRDVVTRLRRRPTRRVVRSHLLLAFVVPAFGGALALWLGGVAAYGGIALVGYLAVAVNWYQTRDLNRELLALARQRDAKLGLPPVDPDDINDDSEWT